MVIVLAVAYVVIGLLLCIKQEAVLRVVLVIVGVLYIVQGFIDIFANKDAKSGAIEIVVGALTILFGELFVTVAMIILGALLIINSLYAIIALPKNLMVMIYNLIVIAIGVLLIISHWVGASWLYILIGVAFIVDGILTLFGKRY